MKGKATVLYSSSLAIILMALSSWLATYILSPSTSDMTELATISEDLSRLASSDAGIHNEKYVPTKLNVLMGWLYPGAPACDAIAEARNVQFDVLKPEYFAVREGGILEFMTADNYICNGYSSQNAAEVKSLSEKQYVMISSSYALDMEQFLAKDSQDGRYTNQILGLILREDFTGVELDFEDYGGWTPEIYALYKEFVTRLGTALQKEGKELIVDLPPVRNDSEEEWYVFRLRELEQLPVNYILIMGYDYQFDHGVGQPVAPLDWLQEVVTFTRNRIIDDNKIIIGVPSYGYIGNKNTKAIKIVTKEQARKNSLYSQAVRDERSAELIAQNSREVLVYQDEVSLQSKIKTITDLGIDKVSIWHLGGNPLPPARD